MKHLNKINLPNHFTKNVIFASFLFVSSLMAQPQSWLAKGIGGGGALFSASISPTQPDEVYITCDMSQLFHSNNFGKSWDQIHFNQIQTSNTRTVVRFTSNPKIQYTLNKSVSDVVTPMRTTDGGNTWKPLKSDPTSGDAYTLWSDMDSTKRLLMSDYRNLYYSTDGGDTWVKKYSAPRLLYVAGTFWDGRNIYVGIDRGLLVSTDNGQSFGYEQRRFPINTDAMVTFAGAKQDKKLKFFCVTLGLDDVQADVTGASFPNYQHVLMLDNNSPSWEVMETGIEITDKPFFVSMAVNNTNVAYLAGGSSNGVPIVLKTTNGGNNWVSVLKTNMNENIFTGWQGHRGDREWSYDEYALGFAVCPTDPRRLIITGLGFPHVSTDGGANWFQAYVWTKDENDANAITPRGKSYHSIGLENTTNWQLTWADPNTMIASFSDIKGIRSTNSGNTWHHCYNNISTNSVYYVAKHSNGNLYAAYSSVHDLYQSTYITDARIDNGKGGVLISTDNGLSWSLLHDFQFPVVWLATDPKNREVMYASVAHSTRGGIYVTKNLSAGVNSTWTKLAAPPRTEGHAFNIQVLKDGALLATYSARRTTAFTQSSGVFLSTDAGNTWQDRTDIPNMGYWTKDVVVDIFDNNQNTWFAGVWSGYGGASNNKGGLYKTTDRGVTWSLLLDLPSRASNTNRVTSCAINPNNTNEMYVTTETDGLWFTNNLRSNKPTFRQLTEYPFRQPERVFFNPYIKDDVWVTSFGNGMKSGVLGTTSVENNSNNNENKFLNDWVNRKFIKLSLW